MMKKCKSRTTQSEPRRIPRVAVLMETTREFSRMMIRGISDYARINGPWYLYVQSGDIDTVPAFLEKCPIDAVIGRINTQGVLDMVGRRKLPMVCLDGNFGTGRHTVATGVDQICQVAFDHLRERGLNRFAFFGTNTCWGTQRNLAFDAIVRAAGHEMHHLEITSDQIGVPPQIAAWLRTLPKPIGLLAEDDIAAREVIDVCHYSGVAVPEEVTVLGVGNDTLICEISSPTLSSVMIDGERIGFEGATMLHKLIRGDGLPNDQVWINPPGVKIRQSTDLATIDDPLVAEATRYIYAHGHEGIGVADVLKRFGTSRRTLEGRFKLALGCSPHAEILRVRLDHAKKLLINTEIKLNAIAVQTGFGDAKYFHRVFRRELGMTPNEFRICNRGAGEYTVTRASQTRKKVHRFAQNRYCVRSQDVLC